MPISQENLDTLTGVLIHAKDLRPHSVDELIESGHIVFIENIDYGYQLTQKGHDELNKFSVV